ncbi:hypothetical protein TRV_07624 [Trichophyton verrucosum HKI 0517]|uniref:Uncharacterized protein n=1 Tax=Trichophyton verrucosum (strain HKI 0517) TaxID=663202 RepID=D4DKA3_TRIVH|nr:uncharacterized protein TRV_07624 [Trichophyton verrucosum HKI 0517]EFE37718.1 hypothetical protein TRV_07624 [Trichophyton verrucosum HKI 0517]
MTRAKTNLHGQLQSTPRACSHLETRSLKNKLPPVTANRRPLLPASSLNLSGPSHPLCFSLGFWQIAACATRHLIRYPYASGQKESSKKEKNTGNRGAKNRTNRTKQDGQVWGKELQGLQHCIHTAYPCSKGTTAFLLFTPAAAIRVAPLRLVPVRIRFILSPFCYTAACLRWNCRASRIKNNIIHLAPRYSTKETTNSHIRRGYGGLSLNIIYSPTTHGFSLLSRLVKLAWLVEACTPFFSKIQSWNPLGSGRGGYVQLSPDNAASSAPLPAPSRREEEEAWFARECRPLTHTLPISPFLISLICSYRIRIHTRTHPHHFYILFILTSPKRENPSCDILACYFTLSHAVLSLHPFLLFFFFLSIFAFSSLLFISILA